MTKSTFSSQYHHFLFLLIEARKKLGLRQQDLASRLGKPQSFVSKYELGERRLDVVEFLEIAKAMDIDPVKIIRKLESKNGKNNS